MTANTDWPFVEAIATRMLGRNECQIVLGDLVETNANMWRALSDVLSLVVHRQIFHWRSWLAAFGIAVPGSLLLMGFSLSVSQTYQHLFNEALLKALGAQVGPGATLLLCNLLLLLAWLWAGGFVIGPVRKAVIVSAILSYVPCAFCLARFSVESTSRLCLMLFILPAAWGVYRGLLIARIKVRSALILAVVLTMLTIPTWYSKGSWLPNWALSWPAWYLAAAAWRSSRAKESTPWQTN